MKTLTAKELALYLGCEVWDEYDNDIKKLISVNIDSEEIILKINTGHGRKCEEAKPILRPLSDMTDEEAEQFALLCMNSKCLPEGYEPIESDEISIEPVPNDGGLMLDNDVELYIGVACRCFEGSILIMKDGRIGICEEDEPSEKMKPVHDAYGAVDYLRSISIDTNGWIEQNLAIDKTTLK